MDAGTREIRRINVTFPVDVLAALEDVVPARQRNRFIVEATEQALQRAQLAQVLEELRASAAWHDEDHPELVTVEDVDQFVRTLRAGWLDRTHDAAATDPARNG
jgi:hypothetical protein